MTKLTVVIDDDKWPKVTATFIRETENGSQMVSKENHLYDTAYTVFENACHNHLRAMVQEILNRRFPKTKP